MSRIVISQHILKKKLAIINSDGWNITQLKIKQTINNPHWTGLSPYGQPTAMSIIKENYILRVVFNKKGDIIFVITVHIAKRGRYESTKD
ncbi:hypothetical protein HYW44_00865 [Candidatus Daviesbacteria bacterium]|nr:hypothetical protein [Candidatus Daviesbacteria bacterium]